jgi:hypothetical protein
MPMVASETVRDPEVSRSSQASTNPLYTRPVSTSDVPARKKNPRLSRIVARATATPTSVST